MVLKKEAVKKWREFHKYMMSVRAQINKVIDGYMSYDAFGWAGIHFDINQGVYVIPFVGFCEDLKYFQKNLKRETVNMTSLQNYYVPEPEKEKRSVEVMNHETIEYLAWEFSRLFDYYRDENVEAVCVNGEWIPSSFFAVDIVFDLIISEDVSHLYDEYVLGRMKEVFHFDDMLEDVEESVAFMKANATDKWEIEFWGSHE